MDSYKHHENKKRKLSKSKEHDKHLKRKDNKNDKLTSWFRQCCHSRKHHIKSMKNDKILETSMKKISLENENINIQLKSNLPIQSVSNEKISNIQMTHLKRLPLYNESMIYQKIFESYDDSCIECTVQYGPDSWEDIHENFQNSHQQLYDNNKSTSTEGLITCLDEKVNNDDIDRWSSKEKFINKTLNPLKTNVNSFINDIIGDGVDRISEIITMISTHHNKQNDLKIDKKLSTNIENNFPLNKSNKRSFDYEKRIQNLNSIKQHQYQYPGLVFEKQNLKTKSPMYYHSSIELSLDNTSSKMTPNDYYWDLGSNKTNINQQGILNKKNSSQNQESYNWDDQEYLWSSSFDLSQKDHLVDNSVHDQSKQIVINDEDKFLSDNDNDDLSYTVASVLPSNTIKKPQLYTNDVQNSNSSLDILNQQQTFSTNEFRENIDKISDHENKNEYSLGKIYSNEFEDQNLMNMNQQQISMSNFIDQNNLLSTINSIHSLELIQDKIQRINSNKDISISSLHDNRSFSKKNILNFHEQQPLFDDIQFQLSSQIDQQYEFISQIDHIKKQKSIDLDSINTAYSIPISGHSSVLLETITDAKDQTLPTSIKNSQSHSIDKQEKELLNTEINNNITQTRSTYDNTIISWRRLFERLLSFILPSIHNTDNNMNLSSSIISPNTYSWSTLIPTDIFNMTQSDSIGPWWGRRDAYNQTPATFIFANESLNTSYSIETITNNKQMCISIENRPCYSKYYSYPNTCHCCCNSSITINNNSSSS
ncbi:unnamed protein product [Rotaria sordida]|uniref:Uncharacterized protein n=1 Tax=Rotaria sordida TaxID=392033 RepID=A0A814JA25_9BILA|nr:unnamed protein product [Rotaria sordida]